MCKKLLKSDKLFALKFAPESFFWRSPRILTNAAQKAALVLACEPLDLTETNHPCIATVGAERKEARNSRWWRSSHLGPKKPVKSQSHVYPRASFSSTLQMPLLRHGFGRHGAAMSRIYNHPSVKSRKVRKLKLSHHDFLSNSSCTNSKTKSISLPRPNSA